jgi:site-specific DNA-cytosine methylase
VTLRTGHLFAGIHGFGLGLDAVGGYETTWTVEVDDFAHRILTLRVPDAEHLRDIRDVTDPPAVDVLTGGFPCQDLSLAGRGAGIGGTRSGLWGEYRRIIDLVRPEFVLIENVPALLHRGFEIVVRDLVELGYRVEWDCIPAAAFGAPHIRDRAWVVAHRKPEPSIFGQPAALFAIEPGAAAELVGGDDDDDGATSWQRWPRAGWVDGDPQLVMPLEPIAPVAAVKRGRVVLTTPLGTVAPLDLWPTPVAVDAVGARNATARRPNGNGKHHSGTTLLDALILSGDAPMPATGIWPTPKSSPSGPDYARTARERSGGDDLATAVARLSVPTPRASDAERGGRGDLIAFAKDRPNGHDTRGQRPDGRESERRGGQLNPTWVEWLMGFPLGWTDPDTPNADLVEAAWTAEPGDVPRVTAENHFRRERLTALGNALVRHAAAWLGARARA